MVQVPTCGCSSQSAGGGSAAECASMIVNTGFCADDATSRPLIQRSVISCNGTVISGIYEMDGTAYVGDVKRCDPLCCDPVSVNCGSGGGSYAPIDREQIVVGAAAVTLVPPVGTDFAVIENIPIQSGRVRWTDTGVAPVGGGASGFGHFMLPGTTLFYGGDVSAFSLIRDAAASGVIEITYYAYT